MTTPVPRKLVYSLLIVLLWLGFLVEGSHALFSENVALAGNSITTGTAGLQVSNSQNPTSTVFADSRPGFDFSLIPGGSDSRYFILKNTSGSNIALDIFFQAVPKADSDVPAATTLSIVAVDATGQPLNAGVSVGLKSLADGPVQIPGNISAGSSQRYMVTAKLASFYATQGASASFDLNFIGTQELT